MGVSDARRLKSLADGNDKLKRHLTDTTLDNAVVKYPLGVWSRHLVDRIKGESVWLGSPAFVDELIGRQPAESLQSTGVGIRVDEIREMSRHWPWSS
jgi:hypothetical protein